MKVKKVKRPKSAAPVLGAGAKREKVVPIPFRRTKENALQFRPRSANSPERAHDPHHREALQQHRTGASNILFVNGERDPFSWGGVTENTSDALRRNVVALVVRGGSHCADMGAPSSGDLPPMAVAKAAKRAWVRRVLGVDTS